MAEYVAVHLQRLEDTEKPVDKFKTHFGLKGIPSKHFSCSEEGLNSSLNCSFIAVYCKHVSCQLPSVNFDIVTASNCHARVRIGQIMIRHKKPIRNPLIRNARIYPCDSAGYQNKLLYTNTQMDYTNGLDDAWAAASMQATNILA